MSNDELNKVELPALEQLQSLGWTYVEGEKLSSAMLTYPIQPLKRSMIVGTQLGTVSADRSALDDTRK